MAGTTRFLEFIANDMEHTGGTTRSTEFIATDTRATDPELDRRGTTASNGGTTQASEPTELIGTSIEHNAITSSEANYIEHNHNRYTD